jgi:predicted nucleic acid-binding protein
MLVDTNILIEYLRGGQRATLNVKHFPMFPRLKRAY